MSGARRFRLSAACGFSVVTALAFGSCGGDAADGAGDAPNAPVNPLDTDVLLAELRWEGAGPPTIGEPINPTRRVGYDNQPHFLPDGSGFWYTVIDDHTGQADIWRYDIADARVSRVTMSSPESEYSATPLPDGTGISTIRVEADSTQRLWRFDPDGTDEAVILPDVAPVGYHAWADENTVVMFVLGNPPTLQRGDVRTGIAEVVAENIGRSIQSMPGSNDVSYVQRRDDGTTAVMRLPADGSEAEVLVDGIDGGDFHAWTPDGTLLMASGGVVHAWSGDVGAGWISIADFTQLGVVISRLAVSPDGSQIALVAEPAPLEGVGDE